MANAMRRMTNYLGLTEDDVAPVTRGVSMSPAMARKSAMATPVTRPPLHVAAHPQLPIAMERIITLHPRFYGEARAIGEYYRNGAPVIMNLSDMEESERKRLVDFASGLVFGHNGTIERVTSKVFLLSPPNVMVSKEEKTAAAEASFFNQS